MSASVVDQLVKAALAREQGGFVGHAGFGMAEDAEGQDLSPMGLIQGKVCGSFAHIIDRAS